MKKVLTKYLGLLLFILFVSASNAQTTEKSLILQNPQSISKENKRNIIQLTPAGYISLPKEYWAYMNADFMDAWSGIIESLNNDFKISFTDGLIVSIFDKEIKNSKWKKELKTENYLINYALVEKGKNKLVIAKIHSANFSARIKDDSDIDKFLEIISQYRRGRCESCFYSGNTKQLRKYFEKRNKQ